jgi:glycosyltransferase involved in cell wall biosynthesis
MSIPIHVDVVPIHNASPTLDGTIESAMNQAIPLHLHDFFSRHRLDVAICCYNDGSTDDSWVKLEAMKEKYDNKPLETQGLSSRLLIQSSTQSNGAPFARNQAAQMRAKQSDNHIFVWLDSDDLMHPHRISELVHELLRAPDRNRLLLGSHFDRDPPESTWHYAHWANNLTEERLMLERYREVTVLQPTWCMMRSRFEELGGYPEVKTDRKFSNSGILQLIHQDETPQSLRLAEDLRLIHAHLHANGILRVLPMKLVVYRHRAGLSQSSQTSRKLLLQLRALAFEISVVSQWDKFAVWGAGRDGKDFIKALSNEARKKVVCMVDVDHKKIEAGHYYNTEMDIRIPVVHFSLLAKDPKVRDSLQEAYYSQVDNAKGQITKERPNLPKHTQRASSQGPPPRKKFKVCVSADVNTSELPELPVVVCVAMYRTNGVLEKMCRALTELRDVTCGISANFAHYCTAIICT